FYDMFFDEAEELLADMEQLLLGLDIDAPAMDDLNRIFRAAHSIKGGAGTFGCFEHLASNTHILANVLDSILQGEWSLRTDMIDIFVAAKDVLSDQISAYRNDGQPDEAAYERICAQLHQLAQEQQGAAPAAPDSAAEDTGVQPEAQAASPAEAGSETDIGKDTQTAVEASQSASGAADAPVSQVLKLSLSGIKPSDAQALEAEMDIVGSVIDRQQGDETLTLWVDTTASADDLAAVCCFIVNEQQVKVETVSNDQSGGSSPSVNEPSEPAIRSDQSDAAVVSASASTSSEAASVTDVNATPARPAAARPEKDAAASASPARSSSTASSSTTLRVGVEKVDQIINLVGELVITQAMLTQTASNM